MVDMNDDDDEQDTLNWEPDEPMVPLEHDSEDDKWKIANDD